MASIHIKISAAKSWHSLILDISVCAPYWPRQAVWERFEKYNAYNVHSFQEFLELVASCVTVLFQNIGLETPSFRSVSVKTSFRTTCSAAYFNSKQFEMCAPTLSHSRALCKSSPYTDWLQAVSIEEIPPSTSFYLPIGRWMVEIRIPGETWDGENRNKDFPMSGTNVSFSTAFPFHPESSCQTEGRRARAHIIPFKRLPVLSHAISSVQISMVFQDVAVTTEGLKTHSSTHIDTNMQTTPNNCVL